MNKRTVTHIGFLMENSEEIWFHPSDLSYYEADFGHEKMVLLNETFLQIQTLDFLAVVVDAAANHTYNSFGKASEQTNFNRLIEGQDVTALMVRTKDDEYKYYCEDNMFVRASLDLEGHLHVIIVDEDDVMDVPVECECACECCGEDTEEF